MVKQFRLQRGRAVPRGLQDDEKLVCRWVQWNLTFNLILLTAPRWVQWNLTFNLILSTAPRWVQWNLRH